MKIAINNAAKKGKKRRVKRGSKGGDLEAGQRRIAKLKSETQADAKWETRRIKREEEPERKKDDAGRPHGAIMLKLQTLACCGPASHAHAATPTQKRRQRCGRPLWQPGKGKAGETLALSLSVLPLKFIRRKCLNYRNELTPGSAKGRRSSRSRMQGQRAEGSDTVADR